MDLWRRLFPRLSICLFTDYGYIYLFNRLSRARALSRSARSILFAVPVCLNHFYLLIHASSTFCHRECSSQPDREASERVHHDNMPQETSQTIVPSPNETTWTENGKTER